MATIKSYSDLEQSKKLAEILPLESADMYYWCADHYPKEDWIIEVGAPDDNYECICAWSLAALLAILPFPVLYMEMLGGMILWSCECHFMETDEVVKMEHYDNPVDACVAMIEKLNELKIF